MCRVSAFSKPTEATSVVAPKRSSFNQCCPSENPTMSQPTEQTQTHLRELMAADSDMRWVWRELLILEDVPALLAHIAQLETLLNRSDTVIDELRAEVSRLTQVARGAW